MAPGSKPAHGPGSGSGSGSKPGSNTNGTATDGGTPSTTTAGVASSVPTRYHSRVPSRTIAGAAVGGLVGLAALILFCMWCIEKRKSRGARRVKAQQAGSENASELRPMNVQPPAQLATSHVGYAYGDYSSARSV